MTTAQIVRYLNLNPLRPETWPLALIADLKAIYIEYGKEEFRQEVRRLHGQSC